MIHNVIFDLDGTLLDTREGILESVKHAAETLGYPPLEQDVLLTFVGPPIQQSFMTHYGCDAAAAQRAAEIFRAYYKDKALLKARPYKGIYTLCERLKQRGVRMAVATYKREDYALSLLHHFRFDDYCAVMHGADGENKLKKRDIVRLCMKELGAAPNDTVLVGDTAHDAVGAAEAGVGFLAVTYGFGFQDESELKEFASVGAARTPMEVADILLLAEETGAD